MSEWVFESERLRMRPWAAADAAAFHAIWGDPRVIFWGDTSRDEEDARARLDRILTRVAGMPAGCGWWAAVAKADEAVAGNVFLQPAKYTPGLELGYHFAHARWGCGLATEAARAAVRHAFEDLGAEMVSAPVLPGNARSQRVIAKAGFHLERRIEHANLPHDLFVRLSEPPRG